jgi:Na+/melibiose symporter-like transporter
MFANVPIAAIACFVTWRSVRESSGGGAEAGIDVPGIVTLSVGLVALLLALDQVTQWGWSDPRILALFAACALLLTAFAVIERRGGARALVPRDVMSNGDFRAACIAVLLMSATFFAAVLYLPQFMEKLLDYSPLEAGAGLLPFMAVFALVSFAAGPLYARLGPKPVLSVGAGAMMVGAFLLTLIDRDSGYLALVPGMVALGIGVGFFISSATTAGVTALDPSRASLAGGILYMFQIAGGSIGLGATTAVFSAASDDKLRHDVAGLSSPVTDRQRDAIEGILAGTDSARETLAGFSSSVSARLSDLVGDAFAAGFDWAFRFDFALSVVGFIVTVAFVGGRLRLRRGPPRDAPQEAPAG